jgi:hypothetical protein
VSEANTDTVTDAFRSGFHMWLSEARERNYYTAGEVRDRLLDMLILLREENEENDGE